ncbi:MAG: hypothetical protein RSA59_03765 [Raoultibacter sp.]
MKTVSHTMYEEAFAQTRKRCAAHLAGAPESLCIVGWVIPLDSDAAGGLDCACAALGGGEDSVTFLTLADSEKEVFNDTDLFATIEGLDPFMLIAADTAAMDALSSAYRQELEPLRHDRLFGRDLCAFPSFSAMLAEKQTKQKAWALLKTLPKHP